jgi:hypothetical protein
MSHKLRGNGARWYAPNDGINVCKRQCRQCLFGPRAHIKGLARMDLVRRALSGPNQIFTCHEWKNVACRGFFNAYQNLSGALVLGKALGVLKFRTRRDAHRRVRWLRNWARAAKRLAALDWLDS